MVWPDFRWAMTQHPRVGRRRNAQALESWDGGGRVGMERAENREGEGEGKGQREKGGRSGLSGTGGGEGA